MKIVYLTDQIYLHGGAEKILIQKLNYWIEFYKYDVMLITTQQKNKKPFFPLNKEVKLVDLEINYIDNVSFFNPKNFSKLPNHYSKLKKEIESYNPDAIFVISKSFVRYITPIVARKYAIYNEYHTSYYSSILDYQNVSFVGKLKIKLLDKITKFFETYYSKIIFLNQEEYDYYKLKNAVIIPNFYDKITLQKEVEKQNIVISLGRLCYQKGYDLLIDAWEIVDLKIEKNNWRLDVFGNGDDFEMLSQKIKSKKFKNPFNLNPAIDNVNEKLSEAAFYVMSSRFETFPMVLLEAMSNKLPVVSFDCPSGPNSMMINGEDGILAKKMDVNDLAEKIIYLIENEDIRNMMSKKAFDNVKRFNPEFIMNEWNNLIIKNTTAK